MKFRIVCALSLTLSCIIIAHVFALIGTLTVDIPLLILISFFSAMLVPEEIITPDIKWSRNCSFVVVDGMLISITPLVIVIFSMLFSAASAKTPYASLKGSSIFETAVVDAMAALLAAS